MLIADAQIHIWGANTPERPWPTGVQVAPQRAIPIGFEELRDTMDEVGIDRVVLVPPSWEGLRNDLVNAAAEKYPDRFASMGRLDLSAPRSLEDWRAQPGMLGVRTIFLLEHQREQLHEGLAEWLWRECEAYDIPVMFFAPKDTGAIAEIAQAHPSMRLIIDHCNIGLESFDEAIGPELAHVRELARFENVAIKVSGLPQLVHENYPFPSLHGHIKSVIDAFGIERCMWGSDLSRLTCPYADWLALFTGDELALSENDKAQILGRSLMHWVSWPID